MWKAILCLALCITLASCLTKTENGPGKVGDPQGIYYDYKVWGEEGEPNVTVMLQYHLGDDEGTGLLLDGPGSVFVDSTQVKVDSAKVTGAFYELAKPAESFAGTHTIRFIDKNKKVHTETFDWRPFGLAAELPEQIKREPFVIKLTGISASPTRVRLVMTDTAFASKDVNEKIVIERGEVPVSSLWLARLKTGPVTLEIYTEEDRPLQEGSKEIGRIQVTYGLKREFELVE